MYGFGQHYGNRVKSWNLSLYFASTYARSHKAWQDVFETVGQFVDGLKFSGGSHSLMPKSFIKEVIDMAHRHDVYVSTGDWAEHLLHKGPTAFKEYVEVRRREIDYNKHARAHTVMIVLLTVIWFCYWTPFRNVKAWGLTQLS